ncbi:DUF5815 family protein [Halorubrum lacusprofundi]|jgi:CRISPR/Cas system CSM-associated protein Csm2 small subunit|uniref:Uncharacterized protein n=1 Tax=Halorubrum lacusprofundi (strain ATCC 49239 / DSM 5036 / JCM 8891 / ACAM 34) TaxID=416348 RepID=B9LPL2_HALLT|nr:DUF5815 family protein [Halorubrum lacusprofundi]ACM57300.1 conserved hypothetical protein [Halorubrum lacusprofundi ATCC 49239]MCG1006092.1 DUF5815 family protein [Halorubrum lacusprofundi]
MSQPRVPGDDENTLELPCGQTMVAGELDLGMREFKCDCGETHAVVMDVHPPERFLPDFLVEVLREAIETTSEEMPEFDTPHLLGVVLEEFPEAVVAYDASENADVGYAMAWVTEFDSRRLHEIVVELVVELMEHAVSHADDDEALSAFEQEMVEFDVAEFVDQYRAERDLEAEDPYA